MASPSIPAKLRTSHGVAKSLAANPSAWRTLEMCLRPLASLKLTVVLFTLAILLVFIGTLAQVDQGIWAVMKGYFRSWAILVPVQVLFPRSWFPNWQNIPGVFPFPGGLLIGTLMAINLLAAHTVRFKLQSSGIRLGFGLSVIAVGVVLTGLVIASSQNNDGLQGKPPISYSTLWILVRLTLFGVFLGSFVTALSGSLLAVLRDSTEHKLERGLLWLATAVLVLLSVLSVLAFLFDGLFNNVSIQILRQTIQIGLSVLALFAVVRAITEHNLERRLLWFSTTALGVIAVLAGMFGGLLGDSSMRILWQLIQGGLSALVLLGGCWLVFQKRAGIVLIHAGILLMMFGELLVGISAVEEQMHIEEGQTKSFCQDIRSVELAIIDRSGAKSDDVVAIPLTEKEMETRFAREPKIELPFDNIPFHMSVIKFLHNSDVPRKLGDKETTLATAGVGQNMFVKERSRHSGTDTDGTDIAAAYVKFTDKKSGEDLGTYLVSQFWSLQDLPEQLTVAGKTYDLLLRFRTNYKPYQMRLIDVRKDDYVGTDTPRNYSSDVHLTDATKHVDYKTRVWMNNPLRYAGQTFYQSGYHKDQRTGIEATTLAVVTNTGWMIPYMACMIVAIGLLSHFSLGLIRFLKRRTGQVIPAEMVGELESKDEPIRAARSDDRDCLRKAVQKLPQSVVAAVAHKKPSAWQTVAFPAAVVSILGGWLLSNAIPRRTAGEKFDVRGFAAVPVTFEGRVKPFDTVARSSLRILSNRDYFVDNADQKQPAIKWLLEVISHSPDAQKHRVFRIENLEVLETLGLERRPQFRYAYSEFADRIPEFRKQIKLAHEAMDDKSDSDAGEKSAGKPEARLSTFQKKILELDKKLQLFLKLSESHRVPDASKDPFENATLLVGMADLGAELSKSPVPYAVPTKLSDRGWEPLATAATRLWVQDMAQANPNTTLQDLAQTMAADVLTPERVEKATENRILSMIEQMAVSRNENMTDSEAADYAREMYKRMPEDMRDNLVRTTRDTILKEGPRIEANLQRAITSALGPAKLHDPPNLAARALVTMLTAYKQGDAAAFNKEVTSYQKLLPQTGAPELDPRKTSFEAFFNAFSPFFHSMTLYVVAFVLAALAWLGWSLPLNRAALWLVIFTFVVHTAALVSRIYISGRPPVTNLYSSAIFIGWGCVVLGMVFERLYRLGIGTIIASVAGFATLLIAYKLNTEVSSHQGDTFTVMQAVLDTQFWLATHVVCITLGYATTYLAGLLGVFYVLVGVLTPALSKDHGKNLFRMIYGTLCFAIFFSFVGTVLGGLWADDSWGRFWGWDPKENGALIIVLWNALVLHARWDGMVKERGLAVLSVVGNIVTSWSWFGVNELGIGLHSYGFTDGVLRVLGLFALSQLAIIALGLLPKSIWWSTQRQNEIVAAELA